MIKGIAIWILALAILGALAFLAYEEITLEGLRRSNLDQRIADFERKLDALDARVRIADAIASWAANECQTGRTP